MRRWLCCGRKKVQKVLRVKKMNEGRVAPSFCGQCCVMLREFSRRAHWKARGGGEWEAISDAKTEGTVIAILSGSKSSS